MPELKDSEVRKLRNFGRSIGLAFQIVDDVLDVTQTSEQLGKTAGKDTAAQKATYPRAVWRGRIRAQSGRIGEGGF